MPNLEIDRTIGKSTSPDWVQSANLNQHYLDVQSGLSESCPIKGKVFSGFLCRQPLATDFRISNRDRKTKTAPDLMSH
ncbi:hypothetical protein NPIL_135811 [Nephila pilipes]|uniref:Uncharacterized protein n=1 Tax=Nephila pilipes TaxID=299642 RepID=A0A8X6Q9A8_NEPPI|nr:hypothetical protein NPIL_135811 [Nephila pilipes]